MRCRSGKGGFLNRRDGALNSLKLRDEGLFQTRDACRLDEAPGCVAGENAAGVHQRDPVAAHGFAQEVGGDEDRDPLLARQLDQEPPEVVTRIGVDARGGFVEDQHLRFMNHRNGQREALAQAERQGLRAGMEVLGQPEALA